MGFRRGKGEGDGGPGSEVVQDASGRFVGEVDRREGETNRTM